jgi:hypothetical protein
VHVAPLVQQQRQITVALHPLQEHPYPLRLSAYGPTSEGEPRTVHKVAACGSTALRTCRRASAKSIPIGTSVVQIPRQRGRRVSAWQEQGAHGALSPEHMCHTCANMWLTMVSLVGLTTSGSSRVLPPPWVTSASSGAKPSTCSASCRAQRQ